MNERREKKMKKISTLLLIFVLCFGLAACGNKEYKENLVLAQTTMLNSGAEAEKICNNIKAIWHDAIFKEYNADTIAYTQTELGSWVDFNKALSEYTKTDEYTSACSKIDKENIEVTRLMKELKDTPKKYEDAYGILKSMYEEYGNLINLVDPTGSLNEFSSDFSDSDSAFIKYYKKLNVELDITDGK